MLPLALLLFTVFFRILAAKIFIIVTELRALELQTGYYSLRQIKTATHNFNSANKIGEGGFGPVYKVICHKHDLFEVIILKFSALFTGCTLRWF